MPQSKLSLVKAAKYILFDLDGTLTDPKEGITKSVQFALKGFGIDVQSLYDLCPFIGPPLRESFRDFYGFDEEMANRAIALYREYFSRQGIFENKVYDGIEDTLKALKAADRVLLLATSKPVVYAEKILERFEIAHYFSFVGGSELDGRREKKSDVIQYVLESAKTADLSAAVMIGDREHDIIGAKSTGIASIGVLYGYGSLLELESAGADIIVKSPGELSSVLL